MQFWTQIPKTTQPESNTLHDYVSGFKSIAFHDTLYHNLMQDVDSLSKLN